MGKLRLAPAYEMEVGVEIQKVLSEHSETRRRWRKDEHRSYSDRLR